jgi:hypothetical protein
MTSAEGVGVRDPDAPAGKIDINEEYRRDAADAVAAMRALTWAKLAELDAREAM